MTKQISTTVREKAERIADMVSTFPRGRSRVNGQEFVIVPSSDNPERTGHRTNGLGCSCRGYDRFGYCSHQLGVQLHAIRESEKRIAAAQQNTCSVENCERPAFGRLRRCVPCFDYLTEKLGI